MMSEDLEANGPHKIRQTLLAKSKLKEASRISTLLSGKRGKFRDVIVIMFWYLSDIYTLSVWVRDIFEMLSVLKNVRMWKRAAFDFEKFGEMGKMFFLSMKIEMDTSQLDQAHPESHLSIKCNIVWNSRYNSHTACRICDGGDGGSRSDLQQLSRGKQCGLHHSPSSYLHPDPLLRRHNYPHLRLPLRSDGCYLHPP